jgi:dTDP-glucose pyrophosphorylase/predicted transcriptional regulator
MQDINKYKVRFDSNIKKAIKQLDIGGLGFCVVVDSKDKVIGVITDGDFRRAILNGTDLEGSVLEIANRHYKSLVAGYSKTDAVNLLMKEENVEHLPILENGRLVDIITEKNLVSDGDMNSRKKKLDNLVVIMAGGRGTRLDPFTVILPKALIPIGDKGIIEVIMDKYLEYGINDFLISVNYKAKMIKAYFEEQEIGYKINYIEEDKPLGTAGALKNLEHRIKKPFFVSNCDIIINDNYAEIYDFHINGGFELTMVASMHYQTIPYGVCEIDDGGALKRIIEKPEANFLVNTGMYILNPDIPGQIPENTFYNMTDLIDDLQKQKRKIGVFPVPEKSWIDVGQWEQYRNAINVLKMV